MNTDLLQSTSAEPGAARPQMGGRWLLAGLLAAATAFWAWWTLLHGWPPRAVLRGVPPDPLALLAPLDRTITVHFDEAPLAEVADHLGSAAGVSLTLDTQALANAGIAPDTPITLHLDEAPLAWALDELERLEGITLGAHDGVLTITTADEGLVSILHPVAAAGALSGVSTEEIDEVLRVIDAASWEDWGGGGASQVTPSGILVRQTLRNQQQIAQLLATLAKPIEGTRPVRIDGRPWHDERLARRVVWKPGLSKKEQLESLCRQAGLRVLGVDTLKYQIGQLSHCESPFEASLAAALEFWAAELERDERLTYSIRGDLLRVNDRASVAVHSLAGLENIDSWEDLAQDEGGGPVGNLLVVHQSESMQWQLELLLAQVRRALDQPTHVPPLLAEEDRAEETLRRAVIPSLAPGETWGAFAEHLSTSWGVACVADAPDKSAPSPSMRWIGPAPSPGWPDVLDALEPAWTLEMTTGGILRVGPSNSQEARQVLRFYRLPANHTDWPRTGGTRVADHLGVFVPADDSQYAIELVGDAMVVESVGARPTAAIAQLAFDEHLRVRQLLESWERLDRGEFDGVAPANPRHLESWGRTREALRRPLPRSLEADSLAALLEVLSAATGIRFALDADADLEATTLGLPADDLPLGAALARQLLSVGRTFDLHAMGVRIRQVSSEEFADEIRLYPVGELLDGLSTARGSGEERDRRARSRFELLRFLNVAIALPSHPSTQQYFAWMGDVLVARQAPSTHARLETLLKRLRDTQAPPWGMPALHEHGWTDEFAAAFDRPLTLEVDGGGDMEAVVRRVVEAAGLQRYAVFNSVVASGRTDSRATGDEPLREPLDGSGSRLMFVRCPAREVLERTALLFEYAPDVEQGILVPRSLGERPKLSSILYLEPAIQAAYERHREELLRGPRAWRQNRGLHLMAPTLELDWHGFLGAFDPSRPQVAACGPWLAVSLSSERVPLIAMLDELAGDWSSIPAPARTPGAWRTRVTWDGADSLLADVVRGLAEQAGVALCSTAGAEHLWKTRVTVHIKDQPLAEALPELLAQHSLACDWELGLLVIRSVEKETHTWSRGSLRAIWDSDIPDQLSSMDYMLRQALTPRYWEHWELRGTCRVLDQVLVFGRPSTVSLFPRWLDEHTSWATPDWEVRALETGDRMAQRIALSWLAGFFPLNTRQASEPASTRSAELRKALLDFVDRLGQASPGELDEPVVALLALAVARVADPAIAEPLQRLLQREDVSQDSRALMLAALARQGDSGLVASLRNLQAWHARDESTSELELSRPTLDNSIVDVPFGEITKAVVPDLLKALDTFHDDRQISPWLRKLLGVTDPLGEVQEQTLDQWAEGTPEEIELAQRLRSMP